MTMIASMLFADLQKSQRFEIQNRKRRIAMELRDMITEILIIFAGGDPERYSKLSHKNGKDFFRP